MSQEFISSYPELSTSRQSANYDLRALTESLSDYGLNPDDWELIPVGHGQPDRVDLFVINREEPSVRFYGSAELPECQWLELEMAGDFID